MQHSDQPSSRRDQHIIDLFARDREEANGAVAVANEERSELTEERRRVRLRERVRERLRRPLG